MIHNKRTIATMLAMMMLCFALTACSGDEADTLSDSNAEIISPQESEKPDKKPITDSEETDTKKTVSEQKELDTEKITSEQKEERTTTATTKPTQTSKKCTACDGMGETTCEACGGVGYSNIEILSSVIKLPCQYCDGDGEAKCYICDGKGTITESTSQGEDGGDDDTYIDPYIYPSTNLGFKSSGSEEVVKPRDLCYACKGSGNCSVCKGLGYTSGFSGKYSERVLCKNCSTTGTCPRCLGTRYE